MNNLLLFAPALRACAVATKADVHNLSHIRVEPHGDRFRYVACNGHILLAVEAPGPLELLMDLESPEHRIHIPTSALPELVPSTRLMEIAVDGNQFLVDPGFPDYRRLVGPLKGKEPIGCLSLGTAVGKKVIRIAELLGAASVRLQSIGKNQACSLQMDRGDMQAYGLVMPVATERKWQSPEEIAAWFDVDDQAAS